MRDLQERRRIRQILSSPILSFILFVILLILLNGIYGVYKRGEIARINRIEGDRKLALLKDRQERLSNEIAKLSTDRGVEEELRNKFQITKKGEEVMIVVDEVPARPILGSISSKDGDQSFLKKLLELIGF